MSNVINFSKLGRKEIRCLVYENEEGKLITIHNQNEIDRMLKKVENPIKVYNPTTKQKEEIVKLLTESINEDTMDINISDEDVLLFLIPTLTNIKLDLDKDNPEHREIIKNIIQDPNEVLLIVTDELNDIVSNINNRIYKNVKKINEMTDEEKIHLATIQAEKIDKKQEKKKQLEELKRKQEELNKEMMKLEGDV